MTVRLASRVTEFVRGPLAAAVFVLADRSGFGPDDLADPATLTALAAAATADLSPWDSAEPAAQARERARRLVQPLRDLVAAVVTDPRNTWWDAPLDRSAQLLLTDRDVDPMRLTPPTGPARDWEVYAQKPASRLHTSTGFPASPAGSLLSSAHATLACGTSDWNPDYPLHQRRVEVSPAARVYEICSAADWHHLALGYGDPSAYHGPDRNLWSSAGIDHGVAPTWSWVAADWDAVHLGVAGLLTALYVPVLSAAGDTTLWAWEWETTVWLRPAFTAVTPLPDLLSPPSDGRLDPLRYRLG